ncbi:hypothetical protein [Streptomyces sp. NPDC086023]|uniref:hypothetical protein n=1 Tax=Streptomyces sp. NPDC086023 TaxID=3365746 RepID=UPI0037CD2A8F
MSTTRGKKIAALTIIGAALVGASPAFAGDMYAYRNGSEAWSRGTNGQVAVKDAKADSREVYSEYHRRYTDDHELRNSSGYGTIVYGPFDSTNYVRALKACVAINFQPDECSAWSYR